MSAPRAVLVERPTEYRDLLARHGTREQVRFFLSTRGLSLDAVQERHLAFEETRARVLAAVPPDCRTSAITRDELDRFLFEPDDVLVVLGQDGLVANAAKYLQEQPVVGLNPDPGRIAGALVAHAPAAAADLLADVAAGRARIAPRTMARAATDDGQVLEALNEVFVGHVSHQSARYELRVGDHCERQSSSGVLVATGTGATGWAASVNVARGTPLVLPGPEDGRLAWFVREAWPSAFTQTSLTAGSLAAGQELSLTCELGDGGTVFADGIEADHLELAWGQRVTVGVADRTLRLVA